MTTMTETACIKKPPRPWSADINYKRKTDVDQKCYTARSDNTYDKYGGYGSQGKMKSRSCCGHECQQNVPSNPPPTPVNSTIIRPPQLPGRQPLSSDDGRCIRLRTISHSAPPLNFKTVWNPLIERHPGSAFDVVSSSAGSSRTCSPEQTAESRAQLCASYPDFDYSNPIIKPIPRKANRTSFKLPSKIAEDQKESLSSDEETLPDRLFREKVQMSNKILQKNIMMLKEEEEDEDEDNESLTLPDKLFKAHLAKQALEKEGTLTPTSDVKPKIVTKSVGSKHGSSVRNGLKDKFVLKIIENFNDQSNALKELSNMKLEKDSSKCRSKKRKSLSSLKKTWSSIMNLAVGVPGDVEADPERKDSIPSSKQRHLDSLYTESMYSSLVGDIYKSRSTACIAAL